MPAIIDYQRQIAYQLGQVKSGQMSEHANHFVSFSKAVQKSLDDDLKAELAIFGDGNDGHIDRLITLLQDPSRELNKEQQTILHLAPIVIETNNNHPVLIECLSLALKIADTNQQEQSSILEKPDHKDLTPLHYITIKGDKAPDLTESYVKHAKEQDCDINTIKTPGTSATLFQLACFYEDPHRDREPRFILSDERDESVNNFDKYAPMKCLLRYFQSDINVNARFLGSTPLIKALNDKNEQAFDLLLKAGADPSIKDKRHYNVYDWINFKVDEHQQNIISQLGPDKADRHFLAEENKWLGLRLRSIDPIYNNFINDITAIKHQLDDAMPAPSASRSSPSFFTSAPKPPMEKLRDYLNNLSEYNNGMLFDVTLEQKEALKQNDQMTELINRLDKVIQQYADSDSQAVQQMTRNYYKPEETKQKWGQEYALGVRQLLAGLTASIS